jgi:hypothetical protein
MSALQDKRQLSNCQGEFAHQKIEVETKGLGRNGGQRQGFPV